MTARRKLPPGRPTRSAVSPRGAWSVALLATCVAIAACDDAPPRASAASPRPAAAGGAVHVVEAEHYHAGTLVAAMQAIESGGTVVIDSSGSARGRASVRQVQQLLLQGEAIDADAVEIRRGPSGEIRITPRPAALSPASAARLAR